MRRGSIIGPLILILLGGLFLLNNLRPDLSVLDLIARGWPYLLIGWGLLRLVEILFWTRSGRPIPINGVTGGEWGLVVLICLFGSGVFFVHDNRSAWANRNLFLRSIDVFGDAYDFPLSARQSVGTAKRVLIENLDGNVHIVGGDVTEVQVTGHKTIRALDKQKADEADRQTPVEIELKDNQVVVRTNQHRASSDSRVSADLEITIPRALSVECHGRHGDFDVRQITGGVEMESDNADVRLQDVGGSARIDLRRSALIRAANIKGAVDIKGRGQDLELETVAGPVTINGTYTGELQLQNLSQPVQFTGPSTEFRAVKIGGQVRISRNNLSGTGITGPILVNARLQDVQLSDFTQALDIAVERGDLDLAPNVLPVSKMTLRTHSGNVQLALPEGAKFELDGTSSKGEVENDFGDSLTTESSKRGGTIRGRSGQGPTIRVITDRGTLSIHKSSPNAGETPNPPAPPKPPAAMPHPPVPAPVENQ